jgi:hypothetical protein
LTYRHAFTEFYRRSLDLATKRLDSRGLLVEKAEKDPEQKEVADGAENGD